MSTSVPTPRVPSVDQRFAKLDERAIANVHSLVRDRIYQKTMNLRRTFRQLDPEGRGKVTYAALVGEMTKAYQLSEMETHCLRILVDRADLNKDGFIDYVEFNALLKAVQPDSNDKHSAQQRQTQMSVADKKRFQGQGFVDQRLSKLLLQSDKPVPMVAQQPTNELGKMTIEAPFGVLGDSERMDSMIQAFLTTKYDKLRNTLAEMDTENTGKLTRDQFREAITHVDRYVFKSEVDALLGVLDPKKRGHITIDKFVSLLGQEFLKKKAHRGAPLNPLVWDVKEKTPRGTQLFSSGRTHSPRKPATARRPAASTRTQALREQENRTRLKDMLERDAVEMKKQVVNTTAAAPSPRMLPNL
eukprot:PhM_4_TR13951/c2_g1_i1/m.32178